MVTARKATNIESITNESEMVTTDRDEKSASGESITDGPERSSYGCLPNADDSERVSRFVRTDLAVKPNVQYSQMVHHTLANEDVKNMDELLHNFDDDLLIDSESP